MHIKNTDDVFIHLLSDIYSAEKQLIRGLAKLARAAANEKLSAAFNAHLDETQGQIARIDQIIEQEPAIKSDEGAGNTLSATLPTNHFIN